MKVTLIDARERPGGTCLHVGCIPSKAAAARRQAHHRRPRRRPHRHHASRRRRSTSTACAATDESRRDADRQPRPTWPRRARSITSVGRGRFVDARTIEVEGGGRYRFENCIVATGSVRRVPPSFNLASPRVMDSTGALKLEDVPPRLLVVGGGYIGLEMGYVYAALGSKVTVVELTDGLLPGVDRDLVLPLHKRLEKIFDKIYLKTKVAKLEETPKGIQATLEGEEVADKQPIFERVLVAVGRRPNSRDLGLDKAGVELDDKGFIKVDERRRTTAERIFAIGDVAGEPMLAHKATYEGKIAVEVIAGEPAVYDAAPCRPWSSPIPKSPGAA